MSTPAPRAPADVQSAAPPPLDTTDSAEAESARSLQLSEQLAQQAHAERMAMLVRRERRRRHGALGEEAARSWYRGIVNMTPEGTVESYFARFHGIDVSPSRRYSMHSIREPEVDGGHN